MMEGIGSDPEEEEKRKNKKPSFWSPSPPPLKIIQVISSEPTNGPSPIDPGKVHYPMGIKPVEKPNGQIPKDLINYDIDDQDTDLSQGIAYVAGPGIPHAVPVGVPHAVVRVNAPRMDRGDMDRLKEVAKRFYGIIPINALHAIGSLHEEDALELSKHIAGKEPRTGILSGGGNEALALIRMGIPAFLVAAFVLSAPGLAAVLLAGGTYLGSWRNEGSKLLAEIKKMHAEANAKFEVWVKKVQDALKQLQQFLTVSP